MANPRFAWGIDIGNRALKAIKLVREGDSIRVDDFDVIEHETVLSNSGDNREQFITNVLTQFSQRHPMKGGAVAVGVSGQASFARFIKLPPVEEKKIPEIVRFEAIQQIPFPLDDVEWSYQLFRGADSPDIEVGIFAMRKELINQHIKFFTDADLNVQVVQMNPLSVYNAMYYDQRVDGTTMIIDLGAENTDLIIADADTIWLRSIPIGGNNFTETLVKAFKLNFAKAEDLKRNAATSKYARQIFQAMRPVFADLVAEVQRSIGFYASVHRDSRIKKIVAVGGTFKLPGLQKYLQQNLQLEVERLDTLGAGAPPDPKQAATFQDNVLSLVSAYGLGLQAMGEGKITSSLLPARIRRERMWQDKTKFFGAAAALFAVGTGIGYLSVFLGNIKYETASDARSKIEQVKTAATDNDHKWEEIAGKGGPDRQRILNIRSLTNYRDMFTQLLADIHAATPTLNGTPEEIKKQFKVRNQRREVRIETITSTYYPDLATLSDLSAFKAENGAAPVAPAAGFVSIGPAAVAAASAAGPGGTPVTPMAAPLEGAAAVAQPGVPGATPVATGRGYIIKVTGTTPFAPPAQLLNDGFLKNLLASSMGKEAVGKSYRIEKAELAQIKLLRDDATKLGQIKQAYDAALSAKQSGTIVGGSGADNWGAGGGPPIGGGRMLEGDGVAGGGFGGAVAPAGPAPADLAAADAAPFKDRQFPDEDIRDDQSFVAILVVVVDPPASQPTEGAPAAPAAAPAAPAASAAP